MTEEMEQTPNPEADLTCHHGWRGAAESEVIRTPCPNCGGQLFVGKGGHLTCSSFHCSEPGVERKWVALQRQNDKLSRELAAAREDRDAWKRTCEAQRLREPIDPYDFSGEGRGRND